MRDTKRIRGNVVDAQQAYDYWYDSPVFHLTPTRIIQNEYDFGDIDTVGLCVKRSGQNEPDINLDFGHFLGEHPEGWIVAFGGDYGGFGGAEVFKTLEDLKRVWELD